MRCLEHDRGADHVDPRTQDRIRLDERDLEGGQVDDVRDAVVDHGALEILRRRDIAVHDVHASQLILGHDQVQSVRTSAS